MVYIPTMPTTIEQWDIRPEERAKYDRYFDQLDTQRKGYLLSDVAVPFFARANLANDVMARIWWVLSCVCTLLKRFHLNNHAGIWPTLNMMVN